MDNNPIKKRMARRQHIYRKRIPYGMMNFVSVRERDCYYVDKTPFIEEIENSNMYFFYIRPRRFGKSLTLSMLKQYYDINMADRFEELFGGLYIGENPTPEHNTYLIISLNFAVVDANLENYKKGLDAHCNTEFNYFCDVYAQYLPANLKEEMNKKDGAAEQLDYLCKECKKTGQKVYLFIDEYDHFTNTILAEPDCLNSYQAETHGTGYLRKFFDTIKSATDSTLERVFVTGVSPVTMDDLTSGFNIGTNYSLAYEFNEMTGFTEEEVREMLTYYTDTLNLHNYTVDELIELMKPWYDNYCFAKASYGETTMYNSNMVLYFIDNYIRNRGRLPENMIEENIRNDYNKFRLLINKSLGFAHNTSIIRQLVEKGFVAGELKAVFSAEQIGDPDNFVSLLYYFGLITIAGSYQGKTKFVIPNKTVREQVFCSLLNTNKEKDQKYENINLGCEEV